MTHIEKSEDGIRMRVFVDTMPLALWIPFVAWVLIAIPFFHSGILIFGIIALFIHLVAYLVIRGVFFLIAL